jgi:hypothetical protein
LPYNAFFLPEDISTVVLSVLISWFFLANMNVVIRSGHVATAGIGYGLFALFLLWMTWQHRVAYSDVILRRNADGRMSIRAAREWIDLEQLESLDETVGSFFGRRTRIIHSRSSVNETFEINECLSGFGQMKSILNELCGIEVTQTERHTQEESVSLELR